MSFEGGNITTLAYGNWEHCVNRLDNTSTKEKKKKEKQDIILFKIAKYV